jgi:hypothetical protein
MNNRIEKLIIAFDQFLDALGPASLPGVTISAHAGMACADGKLWGIRLCRWLGWIEKDHCLNAMKNDVARAKAVIAELQPYIDRAG